MAMSCYSLDTPAFSHFMRGEEGDAALLDRLGRLGQPSITVVNCSAWASRCPLTKSGLPPLIEFGIYVEIAFRRIEFHVCGKE